MANRVEVKILSYGEMKSLIENSCLKLEKVRESIAEVIVGQEPLVDRLLLALLCDGHVLIEGVPGVAKTLVITTLAQSMKASLKPGSIHSGFAAQRFSRQFGLRSEGAHFYC